MAKSNKLHENDKEISNIVIETDLEGHNNITIKRNLKYNRLVSANNAAWYSRKNIVIIDDRDVPNTIIEADNSGNNTVRSFDEFANEEIDANIFKDLLKKTRQKKTLQNNLIDVYLTEKRESLQVKLKRATELHKESQFEKANQLYENVLDTIQYDNYPDEYMLDDFDLLAIKFALVLCKIGINSSSSIKSAEEILISLITKHGTDFPALYYHLAKVNYALNNYKKAEKNIKDGLKILEEVELLKIINWPGTKDNMAEESSKEILEQNMESLLEQCSVFHLPDAKCFFIQCQIEEKNIYFKSPIFAGYVFVECTNKCRLTYHRVCWKKKTKAEGIKKLNSAVDQICITDDCYGVVCQIVIYDENCKVISSVESSYNSEKKQAKKSKKEEIKLQVKDSDHSDQQDVTSTQLVSLGQKIDNKISIDNKFQRNRFTFNLNAKEYIPNSFKPLAIEDECPDLEMSKTTLNLNAEEYIPSSAVEVEDKSFSQNIDQSSQCSYNFIDPDDYQALKCEISILRTELFRSEESYNELLAKHEDLRYSQALKVKLMKNASTETEVTVCNDCHKLKVKSKNKDVALSEITVINEQLEHKIKKLEQELEEFKSSRTLDRQIFSHHEQKLLESNKVLVSKIQDLTAENDSLRNTFEDYKKLTKDEGILNLRGILLEQMNYVENFYLNYITMYENKCKQMIWELQDIKSLTTPESLPSSQEVEANLVMWSQSLQGAMKDHSLIMMHFDSIVKKFTIDPWENICAAPIPSVIPEPLNLMLRHFKSLFLNNKRLEQDLGRHMANYYKLISLPMPEVYPYGLPALPILGAESNNEEMKPPPGFTVENRQEELEEARANISEEPKCSNLDDKNVVKKTESSEDRLFKSWNPSESKSTTLSTKSAEKEPKTVKVGPDGLMYRLYQKYPLTSPKILQDAVQSLREKRGGLTGLDKKTLMSELRVIIADLSKKEREKSGNQKINIREKPSPWAAINNEISWKNTDICGNCIICFEKMNKDNSTQLRCHHVYHTACVKTWLQTNSICPVCRSYITLDEEFPPLKLK